MERPSSSYPFSFSLSTSPSSSYLFSFSPGPHTPLCHSQEGPFASIQAADTLAPVAFTHGAKSIHDLEEPERSGTGTWGGTWTGYHGRRRPASTPKPGHGSAARRPRLRASKSSTRRRRLRQWVPPTACAAARRGGGFTSHPASRTLGNGLGPPVQYPNLSSTTASTHWAPPSAEAHEAESNRMSHIVSAAMSFLNPAWTPVPSKRSDKHEARDTVSRILTCSKSSTNSGTPSSSPPAAPSAFPDAEYCSAIFLRLSRLSGPSWLMMPGKII
jgi:hypothetical protein